MTMRKKAIQNDKEAFEMARKACVTCDGSGIIHIGEIKKPCYHGLKKPAL